MARINKNNKISVFDNNGIRKVWHNDDWWFSVVDVVGVLSESPTPRQYWEKIKIREFEDFQVSPNWGQLKLKAIDGKLRLTDCANTKGILRIIQSIPSKKAEPFKIWLAKVGSERFDEQMDPELAVNRAMKNYLSLGYSEKWINQRLKTIEIRKDLMDEWKRSGIMEGFEFSILTNEMMRAWSGKSIREYKEFKNLNKENLRDNMTTLELALNLLAEATTTEISKKENPEGLDESLEVANRGGNVAGNARKDIEGQLGESVISKNNVKKINYMENKKRLNKDE